MSLDSCVAIGVILMRRGAPQHIRVRTLNVLARFMPTNAYRYMRPVNSRESLLALDCILKRNRISHDLRRHMLNIAMEPHKVVERLMANPPIGELRQYKLTDNLITMRFEGVERIAKFINASIICKHVRIGQIAADSEYIVPGIPPQNYRVTIFDNVDCWLPPHAACERPHQRYLRIVVYVSGSSYKSLYRVALVSMGHIVTITGLFKDTYIYL